MEHTDGEIASKSFLAEVEEGKKFMNEFEGRDLRWETHTDSSRGGEENRWNFHHGRIKDSNLLWPAKGRGIRFVNGMLYAAEGFIGMLKRPHRNPNGRVASSSFSRCLHFSHCGSLLHVLHPSRFEWPALDFESPSSFSYSLVQILVQ